jgi:hypothetical protein
MDELFGGWWRVFKADAPRALQGEQTYGARKQTGSKLTLSTTRRHRQ